MKSAFLVLALAAALPQAAQAENLSYTYVEGGYALNDYNNSMFDTFSGPYVSGSFNFSNSGVFVAGLYKHSTGDIFGNSGYEVDSSSLGLGYHHGLSDNLDLVGQVDYIHTSVNFGDSINGYRVSGGVRSSFSEKFEASAMGHYEKISDIDASDFTVSLEGLFKFNELLGLAFSVESGQRYEQDVVTYNLGLRASF